MKNLTVFCCFFTVLFTPWSQAQGFWVSESFESKTWKAYTYLCGVPMPAGCRNTVALTSAQSRGGTYSLECVYREKGAAGLIMYPANYGMVNYQNKSHFRIYLKWDSAFKFYNRTKIIRWHSAHFYINVNASGPDGITTAKGWPQGGQLTSQYGDFGVYVTGMGNADWKYASDKMKDSSWVVKAGDGWWMMEVSLDVVQKQFDLWLMRPQDKTPTKIFTNESLPWIDSGLNSLSKIDVNWLNSVDGPSGGKFWIDELVISDTYIGPTTSGPAPEPELIAPTILDIKIP